MSTPTKPSGGGRTYWSDDEENYLKEQYFQMKKNGERINHTKLCDLINKKFHSGSPIRTAQAIKNKSHVLGITTPTTTPNSTPNSTPTKKETEKVIEDKKPIQFIKNVGDINNQDDDEENEEEEDDDNDDEEESDNGEEEEEEYYDDQDDYEFEINEDEFNQVQNENEKSVKKVSQTTSVSISNMDNRNSAPFQIELQIPSKTKTTKTTKTTTKTKTTKRDIILSEMDYLKKRLDYLDEKLKNLDLNCK
ncbi:hypothetical protein ACTFIY_006014 [Dictyostelium cf. discoideum]